MRKKILVLTLLLAFTSVAALADSNAASSKKRGLFHKNTSVEQPVAVEEEKPAPINLSSDFLQKINSANSQNILENYPEPENVKTKKNTSIKTSGIVRQGVVGNVPVKIAPIENKEELQMTQEPEQILPEKKEKKSKSAKTSGIVRQGIIGDTTSETSLVGSDEQTILQENDEVLTAKKEKKNKKEDKKSKIDEEATDVDISSDLMEYYPEKYELIATGNVIVTMLKDGTQLFADKMVYNTDLNTIKGYGNVKMVKGKCVVVGDFVNLNLNEENILIEKPTTEGNIYKVQAKEGYIYTGQVVATSGSISLAKTADLVLASPGMGGVYYVPPSKSKKNFYQKEETTAKEKRNQLRAKVIHIKSKVDHDEVVVKNAAYYFDNKKIFSVPRIELTTNKAQDFIETNLPEMGSFKNYGSYFGPGFVANIPGGSTLKLAPVFQIGRHSSDHDFGFGLLGRFHSKNNITEAMWGTVDSMFILRGQHRLGQYTKFQYAHDAYMDEWFMGMRMPQYLMQLVHDRSFHLNDLDADFRNKFSAGYVSDYYGNHKGTMRFRWQTQLSKVLWSKWNEDESMGINTGVIGQTSASLYGTGDFHGVVRGGPFVGTKVKNWEQTVAYFQTAQAGETPMIFDRYMYGKSNVTLRETLTLNKYIKLGYFGSLALLKDNWDKRLFQENQFYVMFGPEDFKISVGYDPVRSRLRLNYILTLRGDDMEVPYDKMIIDDAESLGKKKRKKVKKKKSEL